MTLPDKSLYRPDEVAEYYRVHKKTIWKWISEGKLVAIRINKTLRIPRESLKDLEKPYFD
jgi:excisionase family DNA binding protein